MGKNRFAAKVDSNQPTIVKALRGIPGVTVELGHDDILVGYRGYTLRFELKSPELVGRDGKVRTSAIKDSQNKLLKEFTGHYRIVWDVEQIVDDLNLLRKLPIWSNILERKRRRGDE